MMLENNPTNVEAAFEILPEEEIAIVEEEKCIILFQRSTYNVGFSDF